MTDTELKANLFALETRISKLEQAMQHMVSVGDSVEIESHIHGDLYQQKKVVITDIAKIRRQSDD